MVRLVTRFMPFGNSATQTTNCQTLAPVPVCLCVTKIGILLCYINMKLVFKLDSEVGPEV